MPPERLWTGAVRSGARARAGGIGTLVVPAVAIGLLGVVLVVVPLARDTLPVTGRLDLVTFALAAGTSLALVEPAGRVADATPTGRLLRRSTRIAAAASAATVAQVVVRVAALPAPASSSLAGAVTELAVHIALVGAVGAIASRWHPDAVAAAGAAAVSVLAGAGPELAQLGEWSPDAPTVGTHGLVGLAVAATSVFVFASRDPASR